MVCIYIYLGKLQTFIDIYISGIYTKPAFYRHVIDISLALSTMGTDPTDWGCNFQGPARGFSGSAAGRCVWLGEVEQPRFHGYMGGSTHGVYHRFPKDHPKDPPKSS